MRRRQSWLKFMKENEEVCRRALWERSCQNTVAALMGLSECNYWLSDTEMTWSPSFTVNLRSHLRSFWAETCVFNSNQTTSYSLVIKPMIQWAYFTVSNHVNSQLLIYLDVWTHLSPGCMLWCLISQAAPRLWLQPGSSAPHICRLEEAQCEVVFIVQHHSSVTVTHGMSEMLAVH